MTHFPYMSAFIAVALAEMAIVLSALV